MKRILIISIITMSCATVSLAIKVTLFSDTGLYIERAKDIVIAECLSAPEHHGQGTLNEIDIKMVLKGDKQQGKTKIFTIYPMEVGNTYLLMTQGGHTQGTDFLATAELSVVPVPSFVDLERLKAKDLKDTLHFVFASRLHTVERQLRPLLEEKTLLEKALLDRTDNLYVSPKPIHIDKLFSTLATDYQGDKTIYLKLGSKQMEWSRGSDQSGYIYSDAPGLDGPVWEFASVDYSTFEELEGKELKVRFSGVYIPPGGATMVVRVGQMVLARHIDDPAKIYVMKFKRQDGTKVSVKYAVIENK
ncbi:MAG: hypothetical protein KAT11_06200 [Phycisphaerae bacterium]|nr:hypothetical protein [Phycisphaerae bacterium]